MSGIAKKQTKSVDRAAGLASFYAAMIGPRKSVAKSEPFVDDVDEGESATFVAFAERERRKIMDLGIPPNDHVYNTEIKRRWEMSGGGKSVKKATSKGTSTPTSLVTSCAVKVAKEELSTDNHAHTHHLVDSKLDASVAKAMRVEFAGTVNDKFLYKNVDESKGGKQSVKKTIKKKELKEKTISFKAETSKPAPIEAGEAFAHSKPSPFKPFPPASGKKHKSDDSVGIPKKPKSKDIAEYGTQAAAGRLMQKCDSTEARAAIQTLLAHFGVELSAKVLASKSITYNEAVEMARQLHYETDCGEDDADADEKKHAPDYNVGGNNDSDDAEEAEDTPHDLVKQEVLFQARRGRKVEDENEAEAADEGEAVIDEGLI